MSSANTQEEINMIIYLKKQVEQELMWWLSYLRRLKKFDQVRYLENTIKGMSMPGTSVLLVDEYYHSEKVTITIYESWFDHRDGTVKERPVEKQVSREYIVVYQYPAVDEDGNYLNLTDYRSNYQLHNQDPEKYSRPTNGALYNHCLNRSTDRLEPWNSNWGIHT